MKDLFFSVDTSKIYSSNGSSMLIKVNEEYIKRKILEDLKQEKLTLDDIIEIELNTIDTTGDNI